MSEEYLGHGMTHADYLERKIDQARALPPQPTGARKAGCSLGNACRCVSEPQLCPNWQDAAQPTGDVEGLADPALVLLNIAAGLSLNWGENWDEKVRAETTRAIVKCAQLLRSADSRFAQQASFIAILQRKIDQQAETVRTSREALSELATRAENFWAFLQGEHGVKLSSEDEDDHNVHGFFAALRRAEGKYLIDGHDFEETLNGVMATLVSLNSRIQRMAEALKPFADVADDFDADGRTLKDSDGIYANTAGDFRRARAALSTGAGEEKR